MQLKSVFNIFWIICLSLQFQACGSASRLSKPKPSNRATTASSASNRIAQTAKQYLGSQYQYGGNGPNSFDCSGLIVRVFKENNIEVPRVSSEQAKVGRKIPLSQVKPGDLLFFSKGKQGGSINHVALVVHAKASGVTVIHSTSSKGVIQENIMDSAYWGPRFRFARRVAP